MGCDIHGVAQERWGEQGTWYNDIPVEDGRNYALFAALADVRNYGGITPIDQPRGLPADFEVNAQGGVEAMYGQANVWMGEHSFTWFTLDELIEWPGWGQAVEEVTLRECCGTFLKWLDYLKARTGDRREVRVVIGFDD